MDSVLPKPLDSWQITGLIEKGVSEEYYLASKQIDTETHRSIITSYLIPEGGEFEIEEAIETRGSKEAANLYFRMMADEVLQKVQLIKRLSSCPNILTVREHVLSPASDGIGYVIYTRQNYARQLRASLQNRETVSEEDAVKFGIDICNALEAFEFMGLVERDINIDSILVDDNGNYLIGRFNSIVRSDGYSDDISVGTRTWSAPEIVSNHSYDKRSSIYTLGLMMYWMLNGKKMPFQESGTSWGEALYKRMSGEAFPRLDVSDALNDVILKACAHDPEIRYQNAAQMRNVLNDLDITPIVIEGSDVQVQKQESEPYKQTSKFGSLFAKAKQWVSKDTKQNSEMQSNFKQGASEKSGHQVLISYSSKEYTTALHIHSTLENNQIKCWMAPESIPPGTDYAGEIQKAIRQCTVFVLVLSEQSQRSKWVTKELDQALSMDKVVIPVHIDNSALSDSYSLRLTNVQRVEAFTNLNKSLDVVVKRIKAILTESDS